MIVDEKKPQGEIMCAKASYISAYENFISSKHAKLTKCMAKCNEEDRSLLSERIALSDYICKEKIEGNSC